MSIIAQKRVFFPTNRAAYYNFQLAPVDSYQTANVVISTKLSSRHFTFLYSAKTPKKTTKKTKTEQPAAHLSQFRVKN